MHPLAARSECVLSLTFGEEIRLVLLGSHAPNFDVPLLLEVTTIVKMYEEEPRSPSDSDVSSVANDSSVIIIGSERLSERFLEIR